MKCLVTGGTGFIGSNLVRKLVDEGHEVLFTGSEGEQSPIADARPVQHAITGLPWDRIGGIDVLFHQAAITDTTVKDRDLMLRVNHRDASSLFREAIEHGCRRIVYASSTAAYGDAPAPYREGVTPLRPLNFYAESKSLLDGFTTGLSKERSDVTIVGLRYCNVYGPGESHKGKMRCIVSQIAEQMSRGNPRIFKFGEQKRDYLFVDDAVRANLLAAQAKESCIVNCGSGVATSFNEVISILNDVLGTKRTPEYIDNPYAAQYQSHTECDMTLAKEKLGFVPSFSLRAGLQAYLHSGRLIPQ